MIHVMVDLETFGRSNDAVIVSIGAVKFDKDSIHDRFHVGIDPEDAERYNRKIEANTIMWWMDEQQAQARKELIELPKVDLYSALDGFALWCNQTPVDDRGSLWGNGTLFDNALLHASYAATGIEFPFDYKHEECYRTMKNRAPEIEMVRVGTHHNALDDAANQATHLQAICKDLEIAL